MQRLLAEVLNLAESTFDALYNISFVVQITVSMWIVIIVICVRSLYNRKGLIINLRQLRDSHVRAKLGNALRD